MKDRPLLKQAEQNVVNRAKAYNDALEFVDALANFGNRACHDHIGRPDFFKGLRLIRNAIRAEQSDAIRDCFVFAGAGGEESAEFSRQMFKHVFSGKYQVMAFLDEWGHTPSCYKTAERDALQAECDATIKAMEGAP